MRGVAGVVVVAVVLAGCSVVGVHGPPSPVPPQGPIHCDTDAGGSVAADILIGTLFGLLGYKLGYNGGQLFEHCPEDTGCPEKTGGDTASGFLVGGALAAPWYLSAYYGVSTSRQCRAVKTKTGR